MAAKIKDGRWVNEDESPIDPFELPKVKEQFDRVGAFAEGIVPLTHDKIEILMNILHATEEQEKAILKVLKMTPKEIADLPLEDKS